ncbi:MAG TPA: S16 family serine protease [Bacillota bacterium]
MLLLGLMLAAAGVFGVRLPLLTVGPGPVIDLATLVSVEASDDGATHPTWLMTTIQARPATAAAALWASLNPKLELVSERRLLPPGYDLASYVELNRRLMHESRIVATYVALRWAGRPATISGTGAEVVAVWPDSPAQMAGFQRGDVIRRCGRRPVRLAGDAHSPACAGRGRIEVEVWRDGRPHRLMVELPGPEAGEAAFGWLLATRELAGPATPAVEFRRDDLGGPSAGLAFALFLADRLTGLGVDPSWRIAATGTLSPDGTIQPVGGIAHKVRAVSAFGADRLLVPMGNLDEARQVAGQLTVWGVATFDEAVRRLTGNFRRRYNGSVREGGGHAHRRGRNS